MGKFVDRTGNRFGSLTAIEPTSSPLSSGRLMPAWKLKCDCGAEVVAITCNLTKGKHHSCGCRKGALIAAHYPGDKKRPEYSVYRQMLDRCYLKTAPNFKYYGGEGVTVCDRWRRGTNTLTGFQCFMEDMGARPEGLTLDRKDPRKPYEPDNCRWATWHEQAINKREHYLPAIDQKRLRKMRGAAHRKVTADMRRKIIERLQAGEHQWPIARSLGISQTTVSYIKHGVR